jgi:hypothetical protein
LHRRTVLPPSFHTPVLFGPSSSSVVVTHTRTHVELLCDLFFLIHLFTSLTWTLYPSLSWSFARNTNTLIAFSSSAL